MKALLLFSDVKLGEELLMKISIYRLFYYAKGCI
jgi:hypothetical protein